MGPVFMAWHLRNPPINSYADVSSVARSLYFGLSLPLHTCFVYASSESSGEAAKLRRLARGNDISTKISQTPKFHVLQTSTHQSALDP